MSRIGLSVLAALGLAAVCCGGAPTTTISGGDLPEDQWSRGVWLYGQHCASCHGEDGEGDEDAPPLSGEGALPQQASWEDSPRTQSFDTAADVFGFRYSPDAKLGARVGADGRIDVLDASGTLHVQLDANRPAVKSVAHAEQPWFSADNRYLLTSHDRSVRLWDIEAGVQVGGPFPSDIFKFCSANI